MTDLPDIRNHLYQKAEVWWIRSLGLSAATLLISVIAFWSTASFWIGAAGILSIMAPIAIGWMREIASVNLVRGDKCRRLILYADGLGTDIAADDLAQVRAWHLGCQLEEAPFIRPYYTSDKPPGPQRLADIVCESAFFTEQLASKLAAWLWIAFGGALTLACFVLYFADLFGGSDKSALISIAKSMAVFVSFLIAGDFALIAKRFTDLKNEARQAFTRCVYLRGAGRATSDEVRAVIEDYGISLLQAPPIPKKIYLCYRDELNKIYRNSHFLGR